MQIYEQNDLDLIKKIKEFNDEESLKILINRHTPLCHSLYKKYSPSISASGIYINDLIDQKDYIIYKSALSFDECKKSKFSTWLYNQVRYQCLNCINENKIYVKMEDTALNNLIEKDSQSKDSFVSKNLNDYINNIITNFSDTRIHSIFKMRYANKRKKTPWSKIGKKLNISTQTAINLHNKAIKMLRFKIKSKNSFDKL